jgi:hypothetical protein
MISPSGTEKIKIKDIGKTKKPRFHMIGLEKDTFIYPLTGIRQVLEKREGIVQSYLSENKELKLPKNSDPNVTGDLFPVMVQFPFDFGIDGNDFLSNAIEYKDSEGADIIDGMRVEKQRPTDLDVIIHPGIVQNPSDYWGFALSNNSSQNLQFLCNGVITCASQAGLPPGVNLYTLNSFMPFSGPTEVNDGADCSVACGYSPSIGQCQSGSEVIIEEDNPDTRGILGSSRQSTSAVARAGLSNGAQNALNARNLPKNKGTNGLDFWKAADTALTFGVGIAHSLFGGSEDDNDLIPIQAVSIKVPDNATYRAPVVTLDGLSKDDAEKFFYGMEAATRFGIGPFETNLLDQCSRITVTGQVNTLIQAMVAAKQGIPTIYMNSPDINPQVEMNIDSCMVLVASRFDPTENVEKFLKTAMAITPISDAISQSHKTDDMFKQSSELVGNNFYLVEKSTDVNEDGQKTIQITKSYLNLFGPIYSVIPSVCNFTVPFPDKLPDEDLDLTPLNVGEEIFLSIIRGMKTEIINTCVNTSGYGPQYFNIGINQDDLAQSYSISKLAATGQTIGITQIGPLAEKFYFIEDAERRFSLNVGAPADSSTDATKTLTKSNWFNGSRISKKPHEHKQKR